MKNEYPTTGLIESFCRQLGYQVRPEASSLSLKPMDLVRRLVPEAWRVAVSHHLPRSMQERLLSELFRSGTNWQKTTAFAIPSLYTSFVRVNLRGREPQGMIEPGAEYETLLDRLESDLRQLIDPQTGEPAVMQVLRTGELFDCGPNSMLPDLFVEWKPGGFMPRVVHPHAELAQQKPNYFRGNSHSMHGFIAAAGPSIQAQGAIDDVSSLDLAPTFLSLMGEPIPERMARQPNRGATICG
jgi:predicted AlkP superfamily phosphohydrolase/phosphomutase